MIELDKAWLAGIIDSDGCIGIHKNQYAPYINISNTKIEIVSRFANLIEPGTNIATRAKRKENWNDCYEKTFGTSKTIELLNKILPYLVTKRIQADLLLNSDKKIAYENMSRLKSEIFYNQNVRQINFQEETDLSWLAGLIDGDGSLFWCKNKHSIYIGINVVSECLKTVTNIKDYFGKGCIQIGKSQKYAIVAFYCKTAYEIIKKIRPYLVHSDKIIKADEFINYQEKIIMR